jgi:hypothetical protein
MKSPMASLQHLSADTLSADTLFEIIDTVPLFRDKISMAMCCKTFFALWLEVWCKAVKYDIHDNSCVQICILSFAIRNGAPHSHVKIIKICKSDSRLTFIDLFARSGSLQEVKWLYAHGEESSACAIKFAAYNNNNNLEMLDILYKAGEGEGMWDESICNFPEPVRGWFLERFVSTPSLNAYKKHTYT